MSLTPSQALCSKGDQPWDFFGRNDAKAETPVLWPPHAKSWFTGKDSDAGRDWGQEEKGTTEDEMAGWHHWLDGRESEWTPGVDDGQGGLACCDSWGRKESDTTERLNWTEFHLTLMYVLFCVCIFLHIWKWTQRAWVTCSGIQSLLSASKVYALSTVWLLCLHLSKLQENVFR